MSDEPASADHRAIYWRFSTTGKQHAEVRFILEDGHANVLAMMRTKIADHFSAPVPSEAVVLRKSIANVKGI